MTHLTPSSDNIVRYPSTRGRHMLENAIKGTCSVIGKMDFPALYIGKEAGHRSLWPLVCF